MTKHLVRPRTLEYEIVALLGDKGLTAHELLQHICTKRGQTTKQGVYAALRRLAADDVVVTSKKVVSLNTAWIQRMRKQFDHIASVYMGGVEDTSGLMTLAEGESFSYRFSSLHQLDTFWGHTQNIIVHGTPAYEPVYSYDPHYWFYLARRETERALIDEVIGLGKQFLMTVGGSTALDASLRRDFSDTMCQYHIQKMFDDPSYYVVVIGDYVFEVLLDTETTKRVTAVYAKQTAHVSTAVSQLQDILNTKARARLKISHNAAKAQKIKIRLQKNFYIIQKSV